MSQITSNLDPSANHEDNREDHWLADGDLLAAYTQTRSQPAFEALVQRHGPMVLGVCQRMLRHHDDAQDAFQAVFMVLVQRADSIQPPENIGPWLYGVACRTALKARALRAKRQQKEAAVTPPNASAADPSSWQAAMPLLDKEILRLPEKYRAPLILCELQGHTKAQAAVLLGVPEGTVSSRLARARERLRERLTRRGVSADTLAFGALAVVPIALMQQTTTSAMLLAAGNAALPANVAILTKGVLHAMFITKIQIAAALTACAIALGAGTSILVYQAVAKDGPVANGAAPGKEGAPTQLPSTHASIAAIDGDKVKLATNDENDKKITVDATLTADVAITLQPDVKGEEHAGKREDLVPGAGVIVQIAADGQTIKTVMVLGASVHGGISAIDAKTITITVKGKAGAEAKTYTLSDTTTVIVGHGPNKGDVTTGKIADLKTGMTVSLHLSAVDKTLVKEIDVLPTPANPKAGK